jgi:hypothetical protein
MKLRSQTAQNGCLACDNMVLTIFIMAGVEVGVDFTIKTRICCGWLWCVFLVPSALIDMQPSPALSTVLQHTVIPLLRP